MKKRIFEIRLNQLPWFKSRVLGLMLMGVVIVVLSCLSLFIGVSTLSWRNLGHFSDDENLVLFVSRVPRLISILIAGIGMSVSGLVVQQISLNKFISPTTMGSLDATKLGLLLCMIFFPVSGLLLKMSFAFILAMVGSMIFFRLSFKIRLKGVIFVPLVGIVFGNILNAVAAFLALRYNVVQNMETWLIGDFSYLIKGNYEILFITIPSVFICYIYANNFTVAGLGEDNSKSLGLKHKRTVYLGLLLVSMTTTSIVLTVGVIPFLGLIVPNVVSMLFGDHLKKTLPYTALTGASFLLICDMVSRTMFHPFEIPIGLVISIVGGVIFLMLILKRNYA